MKDEFLQAMSRAANSVCVVTTDGAAGKAGVTVSAMTSVSVDTPSPSLLVCVHYQSRCAAAILENRVFCANLLTSGQTGIADGFAGRTDATGIERFLVGEWVPGPTGSPILQDSLASFDCTLSQETRVGSHHILIGEARSVISRQDENPLIHFDRKYGMPTALSI